MKDWGRAWKFGYVALVDWPCIFPIYKYWANERRSEFICQLSPLTISFMTACEGKCAMMNGCKCVFYWRLFNSFLIVCQPREWRCAVNCIMIGGLLACFSGVREHSSPAARDVDVQDVHWSHREAAVSQLAVPKGDTRLMWCVTFQCCLILTMETLRGSMEAESCQSIMVVVRFTCLHLTDVALKVWSLAFATAIL